MNQKSVDLLRQVVIALKGGGSSGKTNSLRKLYNDLLSDGAVLVAKDKIKTKNIRKYFLFYKRWRIVICEGGDTEKIIHDNFTWADKVSLAVRFSGESQSLERTCQGWDIIVMPAWIHMESRSKKNPRNCVYALLEMVWRKRYSLEIVDREPVSNRKTDVEKSISQGECAKRLKRRIDFVVCDRFQEGVA